MTGQSLFSKHLLCLPGTCLPLLAFLSLGSYINFNYLAAVFLWGSCMYEFCFSPVNLSYIDVIIGQPKNLEGKMGKLVCLYHPLVLMTLWPELLPAV